jgi:hypothetical protein
LRLVQLARLMGARTHALSREEARSRAASDPARLAQGLLAEAADNDDVLSADGALDYMEERLRYFGEALDGETPERVREAFRALVQRWDDVPGSDATAGRDGG